MQVMTRVSAMPVSALSDLRFDKTWSAVKEAAAIGGELREGGKELADELFAVIGSPPAAPAKSRLVAVRRALYSTRRPSPRAWDEEVRGYVAEPLAGRIDTWTRRHHHREGLLAELGDLMDGEAVEVSLRLREILRDRAFQYGLVQGSPVLFEELTKWLTGPRDAMPARQPLLRLVKYLSRVVGKTSPYSTFTISGTGVLSGDVSDALRPTGLFSWTSNAELNVWLLSRLTDVALRQPELLGRLRVRPNPSLMTEERAVRFLGPGAQATLVSIGRGEALDHCLRLVEQSPGGTVDDLAAGVRELDPDLTAADVRGFLLKLVETGVLQLVPPYAEQSPDHLAELLALLDGVPGADPLAAGLRSVRADLRSYPAQVVPVDRLRLQRRLTGTLDGLLGGGLPRKNLFHENAVFTEPVAEYGLSAWAPVAADLRQLRSTLALFDPALPGRRALAAVFAGAYGEGGAAPWIDFYHRVGRLMVAGEAESVAGLDGATLRTLCGGPLNTPGEDWRQLPFAREQAATTQVATASIMALAPDPDGVLRLPAAAFAGLVDDRPFGQTLCDPLAFYLQLLDDATPPRVAVNSVTVGYGRGRSRLARLLDQSGVPAEAPGPRESGPGGEVLVECLGLFGSNLNLRSPTTAYELDYPLTSPGCAPERRIPVSDLEVRHDEVRGELRLHSRRLDRPVRVLHGGMMAEFWLPAPLRHLIEGFGPAPSLMHASVPLFLPRDIDPREGGVVAMPRLEVGLVTISRACWAFPAREMPLRRTGELDWAYWLRFAGWLADTGIPERFYARVLPAAQETFRVSLKARKPTYVDTAIWPLVAMLERSVADPNDLVVITEALPELAAAPRFGAVQRVTELVLEVPGE